MLLAVFATWCLMVSGWLVQPTPASQPNGQMDELIGGLRDPEPELRALAARGLAKFPNDRDKVVGALLSALHDNEDAVVKAVAETLASFGPPAVERMLPLLSDADPQVRRGVARALGLMGDHAAPAIPSLMRMLNEEPEEKVRRWVVRSIGEIGPAASAAVPLLLRMKIDEDERVRENADAALNSICADDVQPLIAALTHEDEQVQIQAAEYLGSIGSRAADAVPRIVELLTDPSPKVRVAAAKALGLTVEGLGDSEADRARTIHILEQAIGLLASIRDTLAVRERSEFDTGTIQPVKSKLEYLRELQWADWLKLLAALIQNPWVWCGLGALLYVVVMLATWSLVLWLSPLWLLHVNTFLENNADIQLPPVLGGIKLPIRVVLLSHLFSRNPRVLDAWVREMLPAVRESLAARDTVRDRAVHVPVPVVCNGETIAELSARNLSAFGGKRVCLLIVGEGGSGKTSLACQIAQWAMSATREERLAGHLMLPVLIEHDLDAGTNDPNKALADCVRGQLQALIRETEPIPDKLFDCLLRTGRILVIIDGLSEMSDGSRRLVRPGLPGFPAAALIVTSRQEESLDNVPKTTLLPLRIEGNRLSSFLEAYLTKRGKRVLFDDSQFFEACRGLSLMVRDRKITALLARLYADQMVSRQEGATDELPGNIPDLMLCYLNELNRDATKSDLDDRTIQRDARRLAWESLRSTFRPAPFSRTAALAALGETSPRCQTR